ncbi:hypothetical protein BW14_08615 [Bifidobacterium sp. UTBIF-68]|uniref:hypothetical protein n=1 Tax=Bifidobacterium sp. UTBIF-68 TaxID=1465262 RepID=UPI00112E9B19|nr:hypothetical protein [Bifidobacterium sp. UTBIF-68]TPF92475.1 hypothetical protein BW14_08615 [Bifidobacterium sp. UTBIF-68]
MMSESLRMCRFERDGMPEMGEYVRLDDGTGICRVPDLNDEGETIVVSYPDGTMPEGISDLELFDVPCSIDYDPTVKPGDLVPPEVRERMSRTNLILEEYGAGVLDEREAGEALFDHLFGEGRRHEGH